MTEITAPGALPPIALTGATGFVGRRVVALAGRPVRALTRRPQPPQPGVEWVLGDLDDTNALARLCEGAAAVLHIAGVVNAADEAGFIGGNVTGTANVLAAAAGWGRCTTRKGTDTVGAGSWGSRAGQGIELKGLAALA